MPKAYCLIRAEPHYRRDAFVTGLSAAGYGVVEGSPPEKGDQTGNVLVIWNRYMDRHILASKFEARGGITLVAENGYLGPGGVSPHGMEPRTIYALARSSHNGSGKWFVGGGERFAALNAEIKPWRTDGVHVLIAANRSFGMPGIVMPITWADDTAREIRSETDRPIRVRLHPGNGAAKIPLEDDLEGCFAVVIWSSSVGVQALLEGIPVVTHSPFWIMKDACAKSLRAITQHEMPGRKIDVVPPPRAEFWEKRLRAFEKMAWAQFTSDEIASGLPFNLNK